MSGNGVFWPGLDPTTQQFLDDVAARGAAPLASRSAAQVRATLAALQAAPVGKPDANIEDRTFPVGPTGVVPVRIVRPRNSPGIVPVVMFFMAAGGSRATLIHTIAWFAKLP